MLGRIILISVVGILSLIMGITGCTPSPEKAPAPAPPPAPAPKQTFTLKFAHHTAPTSGYALASEWYLKEVEKRTNGQVTFQRYYSATLAPSTEVLEAINSGVANTGLVSGFYSPGKTPLLNWGKAACLFAHQYEGLMAFYDMFTGVPAMSAELAKYNVRPMTTTGTASFGVFTKTPVKSLADMKGLKLRAEGPQMEVLQELGAVPVPLPGPDIFAAMDKGTINGCVYGPTAITGYSIQDVGKYYYNLPFGGSLSILGIRIQDWEKLPKDVQDIMLQVAKEHPAAHQQIYEIEGDGKGFQIFKEKGIVVTEPTKEDVATLRAMAKKSWDKWASEMAALGLPGQQVVDTFTKLVAKYEPLNPYFK